jgi:hypothetical protein
MKTDESELDSIITRFVQPFYLSFLHGNFTRYEGTQSSDFSLSLGKAGKEISDGDLTLLLEEQEWRGRLTAAWFIGLTQRAGFVDRIGQLLLESELTYAGQGYCAALGLIGGTSSEHHLQAYLKEYLPLNGRIYDQTWAIGAMVYIKGALPQEFLDPLLWIDGKMKLDPSAGIKDFANVIDYLSKNKLTADH